MHGCTYTLLLHCHGLATLLVGGLWHDHTQMPLDLTEEELTTAATACRATASSPKVRLGRARP